MKRQIYKNAEDIFVKKNNIKIIQTIAVLCTAVLVCGCSIWSADQRSVAEAVNEASVSDVADAADSESWENDTADPSESITAEDQESLSSELYAMDTVMYLTAYGTHAKEALDAAEAEISRLDALLSISSESSDIYRVNQDGSGELSEDTTELLTSALGYFHETDGLFDCTIEPIMEAWGFTTHNYHVPDPSELSELLPLVDASAVSLSGNQVDLPSGARLDLGGIAKGFTSARVMDIFTRNGVTSGIISLGGNVQTLGRKPDGSLWRVGIQDPGDLNSMLAIVEVADEAVITSGTYQRCFELDGVRYHHIIDPRTGYPADSGLTSVTIISPDGTLADALSTSLFIMGVEKAAAFWQRHKDKFDAIMMTDDGTVLVTAGLADRCQITNGGKAEVIS